MDRDDRSWLRKVYDAGSEMISRVLGPFPRLHRGLSDQELLELDNRNAEPLPDLGKPFSKLTRDRLREIAQEEQQLKDQFS